MSWRLKKQLIYGTFFGLLLFFVGLIIYYSFRPQPSCFDNQQNQGEEGVDCGGPCLPCEITALNLIQEKPRLIIYPDNSLDIIAKITNPSQNYGLKKFKYKITLKGNEVKSEVTGESFIMPLETKYLTIVNKKKPDFEIISTNLEINFNKNDWTMIDPQTPKIEILNYQINNDLLQAEIINNDQRPFDNLELNFFLYDLFDNVIGVAKTYLDNINPTERQNISLTLPPLNKEVSRVVLFSYYDFFKEP